MFIYLSVYSGVRDIDLSLPLPSLPLSPPLSPSLPPPLFLSAPPLSSSLPLPSLYPSLLSPLPSLFPSLYLF